LENKSNGGLTVASSLAGLPDLLIFFVLAVALVGLYLGIYTLATMHNEFALIRENVISAATALGFSLVGFALPLASAIVHAQTIVDCLVWGLVALAVQIIVYWLVRIVMPNLSQRIAGGEMAAALFLGAASLAAGIINAAAMTF
jgi:putative membrane protein